MEQEKLAELNKLRGEANRYVQLAEDYKNAGQYDKMSEYYQKAVNLESKILSAQIEYYSGRTYMIAGAVPIKTSDGVSYVIAELIDLKNREVININNIAHCPPFVRLGEMYPVFESGKNFVITNPADNYRIRKVPNLSGVNDTEWVSIADLLSIKDYTVYPIAAGVKADVVCEYSFLRKCGWA